VIEGLDGSGKSTQLKLLKDYLTETETKFKYLHFPRLEEGLYGKLIARFLRGEMGDINEVDPYLVALLFAGDRDDAKDKIRSWMDDGYLVVIDRYVFSNVAFQCAKLKTPKEQSVLSEWITDLEFGRNKLPVPNKNIFLDVPFDFTAKQLSGSRSGNDRNYLKGQVDIHENDMEFQKRVRDVYLSLSEKFKTVSILNCANIDGEMMSPQQVFEKLLEEIGTIKE